MVADLTGDPGREAVTQARKAEVDLAAQHRLAPVAVGLGWQDTAAASGCAQQQLTHARSQARRWAPMSNSWATASWMVSTLAWASLWRAVKRSRPSAWPTRSANRSG